MSENVTNEENKTKKTVGFKVSAHEYNILKQYTKILHEQMIQDLSINLVVYPSDISWESLDNNSHNITCWLLLQHKVADNPEEKCSSIILQLEDEMNFSVILS